MIAGLVLAGLAGCKSNGETNGSGNGTEPRPELGAGPKLPDLGTPKKSKEDMDYFMASRNIYLAGNYPAWQERRDEILRTRGQAGQEFLIVFLAVAEQDIRRPQERQENAQHELAEILRKIAASDDDWGCWYFMHMFAKGDITFSNTVFLPTCVYTGQPLYPYVRRLLNEPSLKPLQMGAVYQALGGSGRELAVPDLAGLVAKNPGRDGEEIRAYCMQGLGLTFSEAAIDPLARGLDDASELVRREAVDGLLRMNFPKAIGPLIKALGKATKKKERDRIVEMLELITGAKGIGDNAAAWSEWYRSNGGKVQ